MIQILQNSQANLRADDVVPTQKVMLQVSQSSISRNQGHAMSQKKDSIRSNKNMVYLGRAIVNTHG